MPFNSLLPQRSGHIPFPRTRSWTSSLGMPKDEQTDGCTLRDAQRPTSRSVSQPHLLAPAHPLLDPRSPPPEPIRCQGAPHVTDPAAPKRPALCSPGPSCPHSCLLPPPPSSSTWALLSSHTQLPTILGHACHLTPLCQGCWALSGNTCPYPSSLSEALLILQGQTEVPETFSPDTQEPKGPSLHHVCA